MPQKTHMISVRLTDAERRKLSQICAVSGLPVSAAIREMIGGVAIRQRPPQELHDLYVEINLYNITHASTPIVFEYNYALNSNENTKKLTELFTIVYRKLEEMALS